MSDKTIALMVVFAVAVWFVASIGIGAYRESKTTKSKRLTALLGFALVAFCVSLAVIIVYRTVQEENQVSKVKTAAQHPAENFDFLLEVVQQDAPGVEYAARGLGHTKNQGAVGTLLAVLPREIEQLHDLRGRSAELQAVIWALGETGKGDPKVLDALVSLLTNPPTDAGADCASQAVDALLKVSEPADQSVLDVIWASRESWDGYADLRERVYPLLVEAGKRAEIIDVWRARLLGLECLPTSVLGKLEYSPVSMEDRVVWYLVEQTCGGRLEHLEGDGGYDDPWRVECDEIRHEAVSVLSRFLQSADPAQRLFAMEVVLGEHAVYDEDGAHKGWVLFDFPELWDAAAGLFLEEGGQGLALGLYDRGYRDLAQDWASRRGLAIFEYYR